MTDDERRTERAGSREWVGLAVRFQFDCGLGQGKQVRLWMNGDPIAERALRFVKTADTGVGLGQVPHYGAIARIDPIPAFGLFRSGEAVVIDLENSLAYRQGHIPGARFAIRFSN